MQASTKIYYDLCDFLPIRARLHDQSIPLIFTNGCFDILHAGHARYLYEAKALGGALLVGINTDSSVSRLKGSNRPFNLLSNRIELLHFFNFVDYIIPFDDDTPISLINSLRPDYLVKGGDYTDITKIVGYNLVTSYGGIVKCLSYAKGISTSAIEQKILSR